MTKTKKLVVVSNGTNGQYGFTTADTDIGYRNAGRRIWPYLDCKRVRVKVYPGSSLNKNEEPIFEEVL